ncbi:MAG: hypothetical protein ABIC40_07430 [bacterium]
MRTFRTYLLNLSSLIGMAAIFFLLILLTGSLFGIVTPKLMAGWTTLWLGKVAASKFTWWLIAIVGWFLACWASIKLISWRSEKPVLIKEDANGSVEVSPEALCGLAKAEIMAHCGTKPLRAEFVRRFGRQVPQVWVDLTDSDEGVGPIEHGRILRSQIEKRLLKEFGLKSVRVEVIHQPPAKPVSKKVSKKVSKVSA